MRADAARAPQPRLHRGSALLGLVGLVGLGCGSRYVAVEPEPAELRVIASFSPEGRAVDVEVGAAPWRRDLRGLFDAGETLEVWVFGYELAELVAAFPGLAGRSAAEVAALLDPRVVADPSAPVGFAPPPAARVWTTKVSGGGTPSYEARGWSDWLASSSSGGRAAFTFALPVELACPSYDLPFRVFSPEAPSRVCPGLRTPSCGLNLDPCALSSLPTLCPNGAAAEWSDGPDGALRIGAASCPAVPAPSDVGGSTARWRCGPGVCADEAVELAVQTAPRDVDGAPWTAETRPEWGLAIGTDGVGADGAFARVGSGALYAWEQSGAVVLHRLEMTVGGRGLVSNDGPVTPRSGSGPLRITDLGAPQRMTSDASGAAVLLETDRAVALLESSPDEPENPFRMRLAARRDKAQPLPDGRVLAGEWAIGRAGSGRHVYVVVDTGVMVFDRAALGTPIATTEGGPRLDPAVSHRLSVVDTAAGERLIVCPYDASVQAKNRLCDGDRLHVYDAEGRFLATRSLPAGEALAVLPELELVYRPEGAAFTLALCSIAAADCTEPRRRVLVPPVTLDGGPRVALPREGFLSLGGHRLHAFWIGQTVGLVDLELGHSAAVEPRRDDGGRVRRVEAVFDEPNSGRAWLVAFDPMSPEAFDRVGLRPLP